MASARAVTVCMFKQMRSLILQVGISRKVTVAPAIVNSMAQVCEAGLRRKTLLIVGADQIARQPSFLGTAEKRVPVRDRL